MNVALQSEVPRTTPLKPVSPITIVFVVLICLLAISVMVRWYAREVSLPRYCLNQQQSVELLKRIIVEEKPAPKIESRRPYIVAAKLIFLLPRDSGEPLENYLARVRDYLRTHCQEVSTTSK